MLSGGEQLWIVPFRCSNLSGSLCRTAIWARWTSFAGIANAAKSALRLEES